MLVSAMGLIMADNPRVSLGVLTEPRALAAVPFAGRYRIIDFILSSMVNSGIKHVGVLARSKYRSLTDHIRTGASWDLDRMEQGLTIILPFFNAVSNSGDPDDLSGLYDFVKSGKEKYVVIADANVIMNCRLEKAVMAHAESDADMTVMYNKDGNTCGSPCLSTVFEDNILKDFYVNMENPETPDCAIGVIIMNRALLEDILEKETARGRTGFGTEIFLKKFDKYKIQGFEYEGSVLRINSAESYFTSSLSMLDPKIRSEIFDKENPVYTKVKNMAPARYEQGCEVLDSLVSDGCCISGSVKSSLIFRGVNIGRNAVIENCIIMQDCVISEASTLKNVIIDKDCFVSTGSSLVGQPDYPVVVGKGVKI